MGRGLEQAVFQRRNTDVQQEYGKMFSITNHRENANISYNEISPYTCKKDYPQRDNKQKVSECRGKVTLTHCYWNVNWISHYGKQYGGTSKN